MKSFKNIALLVALCAMSTVSAGTMLNGVNYQRFINMVSDPNRNTIITQSGSVDMNWVRQAVTALLQDGLYNSQQFPQMLWGELEPIINYNAQLPQNSNNPEYKARMWADFNRAINYVLQSSQPAQPQWQPARPMQQTPQGQMVIAQQRAPQVTSVQPAAPFSSLDRFRLEREEISRREAAARPLSPAPQVQSPTLLAPQAPRVQAPTIAAPQAPRVNVPVQQPQVAAQPQEPTIDNILAGSLGADYAKKAREIYDYNYDKSTKGGFINLRNSLIKSIDAVNKNLYERAPGRKGEFIAPDKSTIADLKKDIDRLHNALQKYRVRDGQ